MNYNTTYPKGGSNKMWEPIHINVSGLATDLTIIGRTDGRDGCQLTLLDEDKSSLAHFRYNYNYDGWGYFTKMAKDITENMNFAFTVEGKEISIKAEDLYKVMKDVIDKCESRYGNKLPDSDYEVLIMFSDN